MGNMQILSFDFDGCLFNKHFHDNVLDCNIGLLNTINNEKTQYDKITVFVGSNRQSVEVDILNSFPFDRKNTVGRGSCFPRAKQVAQYLGAHLDTFLLSDLAADQPAGTAFNKALDELGQSVYYVDHWSDYEPGNEAKKAHARQKDKEREARHASCIDDETKATILYAQMHKSAVENPDMDIVYDFYDDKDNILNALKIFYSDNAFLIPENVTLRLYRYGHLDQENKLKAAENIAEIKGKGYRDSSYRETTKMMVQAALNKEISGIVNVAKNMDITQFNLNWKKKTALHVAKFSGLALLAAVITSASIVATVASFGLLTPFSSMGVVIGTTLLAKALFMTATAIGVTLLATGIKGAVVSSKKANPYSQYQDKDIVVEKEVARAEQKGNHSNKCQAVSKTVDESDQVKLLDSPPAATAPDFRVRTTVLSPLAGCKLLFDVKDAVNDFGILSHF